ncbi:MAG: penicillin-binding transpeptidase domain-containing protein, partial [Acidimicrobiales bacterium]
VEDYDEDVWTEPMSRQTADTLRQAMISVVADGSARRLDDGLEGFEVGGKTGTAQLGTPEPSSHAWIIGFAGPPGETPHVAVAVIVEGQPGVSEQTGGTVAAPIAAAVMQQALAAPDRAEQDGASGSGG